VTDYTLVSNLKELVSEIPKESIVSRTFHRDDHLKVIMFGFAKGEELSEHTAASPAILQFVEGEATLTLGEDTVEVGPGAWVHMAANLPHSVYAKTPVILLLLLISGD
jgi:quercetin dioxygenase-like cupin family protein